MATVLPDYGVARSATVDVDYDPFAGGVLARVVPTTEPQRELWLAARLGDDASLAFNESVALQLRGNLDQDALARAFAALVLRHDALRSGLGPDGETLCVLDAAEVPMPIEDLSALPEAAQADAIAQRQHAAVDTPFDLAQAPLLRVRLLRLRADDHLLLLTAHHIVCDGWSWWVIVRELGALYGAQCSGSDPALPLASSFADYALAEAGYPGTQAHASDERYWLSQFAAGTPVLDLPTDRPRPARRSFASRREDYVFDADLLEAVRAFGARRGTSLFATLLASFAALLSRLGGQAQVVIGIPAAGQALGGHDRLVGHCVNTLPLLFDVDLGRPMGVLLDAGQATLLDALDHQRYTFGTLLRRLQVARDPSRLPLISVMFNIDQALDHEDGAFPGLEMGFASNPRSRENFELGINAVQEHGTLRVECQYSTALFDATTIRHWFGHWRTMLEAMVADQDQPLGSLPLLAETERHRLLEMWNDTAVDYPGDCCVHALIEAQVAKTPHAIAVSDTQESIDFATLNSRANRLARHLRTLGIGPDARVAVCAERSAAMVVALLAVLKAGGAYVPIDPGYPPERRAYMLADCQPTVVLAQQALVDGIDTGGVPVLAFDAAQPAWFAQPDTNPDMDNGLDASHLAYIIYTSGSTGMPKGAMNAHRAVVNRLLWMRDAYGVDDSDVVLQKTPFSFDVSVWELFLPLLTGARLIMATPGGHRDPAYLIETVRREGVTTMHFVPSMLAVFLEHGAAATCTGLRRVISSGEALPATLVQRFHALLPSVELHNLYGPTEAAVDVTAWHCVAQDDHPNVPIGRPIANTRIYVLDGFGQPVPAGIAGEIHIGGLQVGRGYFNRPELTAERFLPDPFVRDPQARMYRTGDMGRWRADGSVEYLGRNDFQVKLRGFRVEPGEIEAALESHPDIASAVVTMQDRGSGDARLLAHVVLRAGVALDAMALSAYLGRSLPDYMVPSRFIAIDAIPLSPNGKLDRRALPVPDEQAIATSATPVAPRDELERMVLVTMATALGLPQLGTGHNFFERGGHSLLAAQVCARLTQLLGREVPLRNLFEAPTARRLADTLRTESRPELVPSSDWRVPRRAQQARAPMSPMQQRLWVVDQMDPGRIIYNSPSAHRLRGPLQVDALERAFQEMLRRQSTLRTCFLPEGDGAVQCIHDRIDASLLPVEDLSMLPQQSREATLHARMNGWIDTPFQLDRAPLFQARLVRMAEGEHVLFFMPHHIIWDGWSFDLFYEEMAALYTAYCAGLPSPLPELEVSYGDFSDWYLQHVSGPELRRQLDYWKQHLQGERVPLQLPCDHPRPSRASGAGETEWVRIGPEATAGLHALAQQAGATMFMVLFAAFCGLLQRLSGQGDIVVGVPMRNRGTPALEPIMGFFVNMLPVRTQFAGDMPFLDMVKSVRDQMVEAFGAADVPFERLVRELRVPHDPSRSPVYQAMFSYQDVRQRPIGWGNVDHSRVPVMQRGVAHDIGLWFIEDEDGLTGGLGYSTDLFEASTARMLHQRFDRLVNGILRDPQVVLDHLDIVSDSELALLAQWNDTGIAFPAGTTLHGMFEAQVAANPGSVALTHGDDAIDYAALDRRANQIANALLVMGVGSGDRVGVMLERSVDLVAALLGVLKTGAAYVPMDPAFPRARLRYVADDANLRALVVATEISGPSVLDSSQCLRLDSLATGDDRNPDVVVDENALAYVIYTSGSTGQPKGVRISHRAAANFIQAMQREPGLSPHDRLLAVTTVSFDISVLELFGPLSVGAQVVLAAGEDATDPAVLMALIEQHQVTVMQATPSTWRMLLDSGWRGARDLRVLVGGEALPHELAASLCESCAEVWNLYGPTETTVWSTCWRIENPRQGIRIGRPIANTTVHVLDPHRQPCAVGVAGELWIGGAGVAAGYFERPQLDSERFIDDPWSPGGRLYRTGDRGCWRMDGTLEHLGRVDHQIKIRGHRLEPGEIEHALLVQPGIAQALVSVREDRPGDPRLVAYVVPCANDVHPESATLLAALRNALPNYAVPQHVLVLDALPRLPNGKVDRNALPAPATHIAHATATAGATPAADLDPRVRYLGSVWEQLLGEPVQPGDNFFDIGGHSMLAVAMANRVARDTGVRISLITLARQSMEQVALALPQSEAQADARGLGARLGGGLRFLFGDRSVR